jgi:hypothetical protein
MRNRERERQRAKERETLERRQRETHTQTLPTWPSRMAGYQRMALVLSSSFAMHSLGRPRSVSTCHRPDSPFLQRASTWHMHSQHTIALPAVKGRGRKKEEKSLCK